MHKATLNNSIMMNLATQLFPWVNVMSQCVPENYKPCIIMAEGPYATLYWAQFLETDMQ